MSNTKSNANTSMNNKDYWLHRSTQTLHEATNNAEYVENAITDLYKKNLVKFVNEYETIMKNVSVNGVLDADKLVIAMQYDITFANKVNRLEKQIELFSNAIYNKESKFVTDLLVKVYGDTYSNVSRDLRALNSLTKNGVEKLNKQAIRQAIMTPYTKDGIEFSTRIWKNNVKMTKNLKGVLSSSISQGQSIDKTSKQFKNIMGTSLSNSTRIIRTETIAIYNRASLESYKQAQVEYLQVIDTEDDRTCDECESHNGDLVKIADASVGDNIPVFHPNCRCCTIPVIQYE